jgi:hypothetical protein
MSRRRGDFGDTLTPNQFPADRVRIALPTRINLHSRESRTAQSSNERGRGGEEFPEAPEESAPRRGECPVTPFPIDDCRFPIVLNGRRGGPGSQGGGAAVGRQAGSVTDGPRLSDGPGRRTRVGPSVSTTTTRSTQRACGTAREATPQVGRAGPILDILRHERNVYRLQFLSPGVLQDDVV